MPFQPLSILEGAAPPRAARRGILLAACLLVAVPALAADPAFTSGSITVERPWSRATPGSATVAAGYLVIRNAGDAPDRLVSATAEIAGRTGPHSMAMTGGIMEMRPMPAGIAVPPHGTVALSPSGDHLMFEALKRPLKRGDRFAGTLTFDRAGAIPVTFTVESIGARVPAGAAPERPATPR